MSFLIFLWNRVNKSDQSSHSTCQMEAFFQGTNIQHYVNNFQIEKSDIFRNYPELAHTFPFASVVIYYFCILLIPKLWGTRKLPGIKFIQTIWNLFLAILSIAMLVGMLYYWVDTIDTIGFENTLCTKTVWQNGPLSFWGYIFALSKFIELFDTLWLILSGKSVPFLVRILFFLIGRLALVPSYYCFVVYLVFFHLAFKCWFYFRNDELFSPFFHVHVLFFDVHQY
jgi:hypothetical protein